MNGQTRFADLASDIERLYMPPLRRPATYAKVRQCLSELSEHITLCSELKPVAIAAWLQSRPDRSPATQRSLLRVARMVCNYAVAYEYVNVSPFAVRRRWVEPDGPMRRKHHSIEDIRSVLISLKDQASRSWSGHRLYAMASLFAYTGLRKNEGLYLRVSDIDIGRGVLSIVPTSERPLKTAGSAASLPMPTRLSGVIGEWIPACRSEWLFPGIRRLGPWSGGAPGFRALDQLKAAGAACGVEGFTFLSLRHSLATHGASFAWSASDIQHVLRHTSINTQRYYVHADDDRLRSVLEAVDYGAV